MEVLHHLQGYLGTYGYLGIFVIVGLESAGIPMPGETVLVAAAILAGQGKLNIFGVITAAAAGAIIGDNCGYWVGREFGFRLVYRFGRYVRLDERRLKLGQYLFLRHGGKIVFFGRFVAILRAFAAFLAGSITLTGSGSSCSTPPVGLSGRRSTAPEPFGSAAPSRLMRGRSAWPFLSRPQSALSSALSSCGAMSRRSRMRRRGLCPGRLSRRRTVAQNSASGSRTTHEDSPPSRGAPRRARRQRSDLRDRTLHRADP